MSEMEKDIEKTDVSGSDILDTDSDTYTLPPQESPIPESVTKAVKKPMILTAGRFLLIALIISSVIIFISGFIRYTELQNDKRALQEQIAQKEESIEEKEYLLDIPLTDKDYIIRIAKEKLGLFLPDEIVYYSDLND